MVLLLTSDTSVCVARVLSEQASQLEMWLLTRRNVRTLSLQLSFCDFTTAASVNLVRTARSWQRR